MVLFKRIRGVDQAGFELRGLPAFASECWDQRRAPSQLMIPYSSRVRFILPQSVQLICLVL